MNNEQCEHANQRYERHSLTCSDCLQSGLEQHLKDNDFPASFTEVHLNAETGFSIIRINNHIDQVTFFRSFAGAEYLGRYMICRKRCRLRGSTMMFPTKEQVKQVREMNPKGTRVELVSMSDPYTTLKAGDQGTVNFVDDAGTIFVNWDCGSRLGVVLGVDIIKHILS